MTDEQKNKSPDEEYQFPRDEYVSPEKPHGDAEKETSFAGEVPPSRFARFISFLPKNLLDFKNKRILLVIGGVIILILIIHFASTTKKTPELTPIATQSAQPAPVTQPTDVQSTLGVLQASGSRTQTEIQNIKSQLLDMQNNVDQMRTQNQQLQQSIGALTTQVQDLTEQLNNALTRIRPGRGAHAVVYHLRAVVPDRAWIATARGQTMSVTIGDHIRQYGTVRSIDAQNGTITTSSGRVIKYGANDY